jgi:hypothetical protein
MIAFFFLRCSLSQVIQPHKMPTLTTELLFFCLQTDDLLGRLNAHRSKEGMRDATVLYVLVPGKSVACQLETLLINQLPSRGFKLMNKADGKHRNFGISRISGEAVATRRN